MLPLRNKDKLWVLEDDEQCTYVFKDILGMRYDVKYFTSIKDLFELLKTVSHQDRPQLLLVDLRLTEGCMTDYLTYRTNVNAVFPSYMVVSSLDDADVLRYCFDQGAIDYIIKPFKKDELIVKVERALITAKKALEAETSNLWPQSLKGQLTKREQQIFSLFSSNIGKMFTRNEVMSRIWSGSSVDAKVLDVHLSNMRKKIKPYGYNIKYVADQQWQMSYLADRVNPPVFAERAE